MGNPLQSKLDLTLGVAIGSTPKNKKEEFARQLQIQFRQTLLHRKGYPSHRPLSWSPLLIFSINLSFSHVLSRRDTPNTLVHVSRVVFSR